MIKHKFSEDVLDTILYIVIGDACDTQEDGIRTYWEYVDEDRTMVLNMDELKTQTIFMKTLVHELLHFVGYNLRRKWIDHTALTEEIYCYLYDFYFGKIRWWIKKKKIMEHLK